MIKDYKNKALQATVSYSKDTNNAVYRSNTINWLLMAITMHTSNAAIRYLRGQFPDRLMSKRGDWPWPPGLDLTVCDFFLWRYLKHQIWNFLLSNSQAIWQSFEKQLHIIAFNILEQDMIEKAFDFMLSRTERCVQDDGHAFSNE